MELSIKPCHINNYPKNGVLIKGASTVYWLNQIQQMELSLNSIVAYPVAGIVANEVYGCVVFFKEPTIVKDIGSNNYLQLVNNKLFIPEYSILSPFLADAEWERLFSGHYYFYHPETGLAELETAVDWSMLITFLPPVDTEITIPLNTVNIPQQVSAFFIEADPEELAATLDDPFGESDTEKLPFDMQKLLNGNQKEMDKFLKFLEENPDQALKYAIPLDSLGTGRGGYGGKFTFGKNSGFGRSGFQIPQILKIVLIVCGAIIFLLLVAKATSGVQGGTFPVFLFIFFARLLYYLATKNDYSTGSKGRGGGSALIDSARFTTLKQRYEKMALDYIKQGEHVKAANIYLKLLKNNHQAAIVLENGKCYAEAATVYLKYCNDYPKAAECYEKGKVYTEAIKLYKELNNYEKAGDLYVLLGHKENAEMCYNRVADDYKKHKQYIKASLIYSKKMHKPHLAQELLMEGWNTNIDAYNCLNNFFSNISDTDAVIYNINHIYKEVNEQNSNTFLQVIKLEYKKHEELQEPIKDIAYEIIAGKIAKDPFVTSEIIFFNKQDKTITKDVMKYKAQNK